MTDDPFIDPDGGPRVLFGTAVLSCAPQIAELAGRVGFDTVWLEVEHGGASYAQIEQLCMAVESGGAIPTVRLPNHHREHVTRALEVGARIVVVPMVNEVETAREIVRWGKFPPQGERGFNSRSRGVGYGLQPPVEAFEQANRRTHLFAQIETVGACRNIEGICCVDGLAGIFVGPGDLSVSLGKMAQFGDPDLAASVTKVIRTARAAGKHAGILTSPGPLLDAAIEAGADLVFCAGDINDLARAWRDTIRSFATNK